MKYMSKIIVLVVIAALLVVGVKLYGDNQLDNEPNYAIGIINVQGNIEEIDAARTYVTDELGLEITREYMYESIGEFLLRVVVPEGEEAEYIEVIKSSNSGFNAGLEYYATIS